MEYDNGGRAAPGAAYQLGATTMPADTETDVVRDSDAPATGPVGEGNHIVRQGECIESIAYQRGFFWETIWDHPNNASLRNCRADPNVLLPGDQVFVPDIRIREETVSTGQAHRFVRRGVPSKLRIRLMDHEGRPRAAERCRLIVDGRLFLLTSNNDGEISVPILPNATTGHLVVGEEDDFLQEEYELALGQLDPLSSLTGVQARLRALRLYDGPIDGQMSQQTVEAISHFQATQGLEPTGALTVDTRQALERVHGF